MQDILQVLQTLSNSSQFICLEKKDQIYYLCSVKDLHLKYSENWETQMFELNDNFSSQLQQKIDITSIKKEFTKYILSFVQSLNKFYYLEQKIKCSVQNIQDESIQKTMIKNHLLPQEQSSEEECCLKFVNQSKKSKDQKLEKSKEIDSQDQEEKDDDFSQQSAGEIQSQDVSSEQRADSDFEENEDQSQEQNEHDGLNESSDESWNVDDYLQESSEDSWDEGQSDEDSLFNLGNRQKKNISKEKKINTGKDNQDSFEEISKIQQILNNYQSLIIQTMYEQNNYQAVFKNPLLIDLNEMKKIHFKKVNLALDAEIESTDFSNSLAIDYSKNQFFRIQNLLEQENVTLTTDLLLLNIKLALKYGCDCDQCQDRAFGQTHEKKIQIPNIGSNYIYLIANSVSKFSDVCLTLEPPKELLLINQNRIKVMVRNNKCDGQKEVKIKFLGYKALQIPSIMKGHKCFIYHPLINKISKNLSEHLLEDQTLLKIQVFKKIGLFKAFNPNICMLLCDLLLE
ncbi:hypothetical protein ABPG74_017430 [Tetrahymena malaccensis]